MRKARDMTQADLAAGRLSESYVSLVESGRRTPTPEVLEHIAAVLGCSVDELLGLERPPGVADAELLIRRGEWASESGRLEAAIDDLRRGIDLAERLGADVLANRGRSSLAKALELDGRLHDAIEIWGRLVDTARRDPSAASLSVATVALSRCHRELGEIQEAIQVGEAFWGDATAVQGSAPPEDLAVVGATLLAGYLELGDLARSQQLASELVELADSIATPRAAGSAYWNAAMVAHAEGRIPDALRLAERAQANMAQTEDVRNKARLQVTVAGLRLRLTPPELDQAIRLLCDAKPVLEQFGSPVDLCYCDTEMARAHLQSGEPERARAEATSALESLEKAGTKPIEAARTLMVLAAAENATGDKRAAHAATRRAAKILEDAGASRQAGSAWRELAEICLALNQNTKAIEAFRKATDLLGATRTAGTAPSNAASDQRRRSEAS